MGFIMDIVQDSGDFVKAFSEILTKSDTKKSPRAYNAREEVLLMRKNYGAPGASPTASERAYTAGTCTAVTCTAVIGSMTQAMKAQSVLSEAAIRSTLTKISSSKTHNGCAYGVDFPCTQSGNVRTVLERAGVRVRDYLKE
jgi:hypothetical protein